MKKEAPEQQIELLLKKWTALKAKFKKALEDFEAAKGEGEVRRCCSVIMGLGSEMYGGRGIKKAVEDLGIKWKKFLKKADKSAA